MVEREIVSRNRLYLVIAGSGREYEDWQRQNPSARSRYTTHENELRGRNPDDVLIAYHGSFEQNRLYRTFELRELEQRIGQSLMNEITQMAQAEEEQRRFAIMVGLDPAIPGSDRTVVTVTHSCSNCQYFYSGICNALKSPTEDITAANECSDWAVKDEAEESKRNQALQARVTRQTPERRHITQRWEDVERDIFETRRRENEVSPHWYPDSVTLTELQRLMRQLPSANQHAHPGETRRIVLAGPMSFRPGSNIEQKEVTFIAREFYDHQGLWIAWEYTGNLGMPIME